MALFTKNPNSHGLISKIKKLYNVCCTDVDDTCCVTSTGNKPAPKPEPDNSLRPK
jgi:hypothetical protein